MVTSRSATQTTQTESTTYSLQIVPPGLLAELALRLRYRVFTDEMEAQYPDNAGHDLDEWDAHCDHLMVRDDRTSDVVGSYRILSPRVAQQLVAAIALPSSTSHNWHRLPTRSSRRAVPASIRRTATAP